MLGLVLFLLVVGLGIVALCGSIASVYIGLRRRRERRRQSARAMALRFRRRYGANAEAAADKSLTKTNLSPRRRKFFKLVALELKGAGQSGESAKSLYDKRDPSGVGSQGY